MAKEKLVVIKEAHLTNNCPECFNQDLRLSFYQKHYHTRLVHRTSNEVSHQIVCNKCKSTIYPISWTDDIERTFDYYKKMVEPKRSSTKFTSLFWIVVLAVLVAVGLGIYLVLRQ
ncbi:hypothetical protein [Pseudozobellia thermophila]|uniref:Uncharacterized protein n=1 Tax=Pseudozobellia thermophila TaxID=192903 RepID=A0A1M6AJM6_9FLAO|nr:hypothetical protein [Pseudozobellia thermophila]SHI36690.1 hypothetical protein SAMN04488513_10182 [Pseudozobellia thermophila]